MCIQFNNTVVFANIGNAVVYKYNQYSSFANKQTSTKKNPPKKIIICQQLPDRTSTLWSNT